jgi:hypothetical protein
MAAWIKLAAQMGLGRSRSKGEIIGYGTRRFILGLHGEKPPFQLAARINVNDVIECPRQIEADE